MVETWKGQIRTPPPQKSDGWGCGLTLLTLGLWPLIARWFRS